MEILSGCCPERGREREFELSQVFGLAKWRCVVHNKQLNHPTPGPTSGFCRSQRPQWGSCRREFASVSDGKRGGEDREQLFSRLMPPLLFIGLTRVSVFPRRRAPPSCREHGRLSVIPKHGSIKAFWLLTRPGYMVDEWRAALREARQGFCLVTLFSASRWEITQTGWLGVTHSRVHLLREPVTPFHVPVLERMTNLQEYIHLNIFSSVARGTVC